MRKDTERPRAEAYWQAVQSRDRGADGVFVYAVRSTGIYCRPSCASRKPRREQVVFFPVPEAAERKGFRACQRCRPRAAHLHDPRAEAVERICRRIDSQIQAESEEDSNNSLTLHALGASVGLGPHQLERAFRRVMGITPRQYADAQRMRRLKFSLKKGDDVTTALYDAGYSSSSRLYERSPSQLGMTPATYRQGGAGMQIHYTIVDSPLGRLLVGATDRGISALYLGETDARLESALRKEYPRAEVDSNSAGSKSLGEWVNKILAHLRGKEPHLDLPTDVQATAFPPPCLGRAEADPLRRHSDVLAGCASHWASEGYPCSRQRLRYKSCFSRRSVPPCGARRRKPRRIPLGTRPQACTS